MLTLVQSSSNSHKVTHIHTPLSCMGAESRAFPCVNVEERDFSTRSLKRMPSSYRAQLFEIFSFNPLSHTDACKDALLWSPEGQIVPSRVAKPSKFHYICANIRRRQEYQVAEIALLHNGSVCVCACVWVWKPERITDFTGKRPTCRLFMARMRSQTVIVIVGVLIFNDE